MSSKITGNAHSTLLNSLLEVANNTSSKEQKQVEKTKRIASNFQDLLKPAQANLDQEHGWSNVVNDNSITPEEFLGNGDPEVEDNDPGVDSAKQSLVDALISLCGSVEEAIQCIRASDNTDESALESDDNVIQDDIIPSNILDGT